MEKIKLVSILIFLTILLIFSISLIFAGASHAGNPVSLTNTTCSLVTQELIECDGGKWLNIWNGGMVVENIFAKTKQDYFTEKYKINNTYPCLCHNAIVAAQLGSCIMTHLCYLDTEVTLYVQKSEAITKYGSDVMIAVGSLLLGTLFVFAVIQCKRKIQNSDYVLG